MSVVADATATPRAVPGDGLLNPVAITAIAVLVLNDHLLKAAFPGPITGKISDFCGLVFFPLALQAVFEVSARILGRDATANQRVLLAAIATTGIVFTAVKSIPEINSLAEFAIGWLQGAAARPRIALDATDLIALPTLLMAWHVGAGRARAD